MRCGAARARSTKMKRDPTKNRPTGFSFQPRQLPRCHKGQRPRFVSPQACIETRQRWPHPRPHTDLPRTIPHVPSRAQAAGGGWPVLASAMGCFDRRFEGAVQFSVFTLGPAGQASVATSLRSPSSYSVRICWHLRSLNFSHDCDKHPCATVATCPNLMHSMYGVPRYVSCAGR